MVPPNPQSYQWLAFPQTIEQHENPSDITPLGPQGSPSLLAIPRKPLIVQIVFPIVDEPVPGCLHMWTLSTMDWKTPVIPGMYPFVDPMTFVSHQKP